MSKAYVLLSGGIDSSTCLAIAHERYEGSVTAVAINYGQRHQKELRHAMQVAEHYEVPFVLVRVPDVLGKGGLTDPNLVMPQASYAELPAGVSPTYVPFRNGFMLSLLASQASADPEAEAIYYGAHAEDAENDAYPDCSAPFIDAMREGIRIGTYDKITLQAPLFDMTKKTVVEVGSSMDVPYNLTWSCYEGKDLHCGTCPTCLSRKEAFQLAGVEDPTIYLRADVQ